MATVARSLPKDPQTFCPLFKLPPELRNNIYELAFTPMVDANKDGTINLIGAKAPTTGLSLACQKLYPETRALHQAASDEYFNNEFAISARGKMMPPLQAFPCEHHCARITKIVLDFHDVRHMDTDTQVEMRGYIVFNKQGRVWHSDVTLHEYAQEDRAGRRKIELRIQRASKANMDTRSMLGGGSASMGVRSGLYFGLLSAVPRLSELELVRQGTPIRTLGPSLLRRF